MIISNTTSKRITIRICCITTLIIGTTLLLFSQTKSQLDSLERILSKADEDTIKVIRLNDLAFTYSESEPDKCILYAEKSYALAKKLNFTVGTTEALSCMAGGYLTKGNFEKALELYNNALKICEETKSEINSAVVINNIGNVYLKQGNFDAALQNYFTYLIFVQKTGEKDRIAAANTNIGTTLLSKGDITHAIQDYQDAIKYTTKALELETELGNKFNISVNLGNLGAIQVAIAKLDPTAEKLEKALDYLQKSLKIKREVNDEIGIAINLINMAEVLIEQGKLLSNTRLINTAISTLKEAVVIANKIGNTYIVSFGLNRIAFGFSQKNIISFNSATADSAIKYYKEGLKIAEEINAKDIRKQIYSSLSQAYEQKGNFKAALSYERQYSNLKDSTLSEENTKNMNELMTKYETAEKDKKIIKKDAEIIKQQAESDKKAMERNAFIVGFSLMLILSFFIFNGYRQKHKANLIIAQQKKDVEIQKDIIEEKNKDITDSINYARRIQRAMLTSDIFFKNNFDNYFILYKPKDIVSGDFYWGAKTTQNTLLVAAADCTGHGVPGAFMSMIGISKLNEIVVEQQITQPAKVLDHLRNEVIKAINPEDAAEVSKDGMDISLFAYYPDKMKLEFAGANNAIYLIRNAELSEKKVDKMPVGISGGELKPFTNHELTLEKGDVIYLLTDGYPDQFGEHFGKKFKYKQLEDLFVSIHTKTMAEQNEILTTTFEKWKGSNEQTDDVLIIGIKI